MNAHTPGPWKRHHIQTSGDIDIITEYGKAVFVANVCEIGAEGEANARLIAAAPELFDALKDILAENSPGNYRRALKALAKAEGRE